MSNEKVFELYVATLNNILTGLSRTEVRWYVLGARQALHRLCNGVNPDFYTMMVDYGEHFIDMYFDEPYRGEE